jgi:hypothetical protein
LFGFAVLIVLVARLKRFMTGSEDSLVNVQTGFRCCWLPKDYPKGRDCEIRSCCEEKGIEYCGECPQFETCLRMKKFYSKSGYARACGKREYLNDTLTLSFAKNLNAYFKTKVATQRIRMGKNQEIETLINEEAFVLASYLRNEKRTWIPRTANLS